MLPPQLQRHGANTVYYYQAPSLVFTATLDKAVATVLRGTWHQDLSSS
jgi:hypothetical protein